MTFSHEDANERLLDLVYGEAAPAEREALEAHVATCAKCQAELAALGDTRARLRVALDDQPAPSRVHASILAAAAAEASNGAAGAATAPPAKGNEPASRAARPAEGPSFWERLRSKWTFPTFATVGAVAVMLLGAKVFFDPQQSLERGKEIGSFAKAPVPQQEVVEPVAPSADEPEAQVGAPAAAPAAEAEGALNKLRRDEDRLSPQARARLESVRTYGGPRSKVSDLLGNKPAFKTDSLGGAPASRAIGRLRPEDFGAGRGTGSVAGGAAAPAQERAAEKEAKPAKGSMDDLLDGALSSGSGSRYAKPPAEWKGGQPGGGAAAAAPPPAPKPSVAKKRSIEDNPLDEIAPREAEASRPSRAPVAREEAEAGDVVAERSPVKRKAAPAAEPPPPPAAPAPVAAAPAARAQSADKAEAPPADAKKEKDAAASYQALARRADELYAAGRWAEATAAYTDLLRRFPTAELAPRWRARLATAQREAAPPPAATSKPAARSKAGKAAAADAFSE
jgi:hypothetical protein